MTAEVINEIGAFVGVVSLQILSLWRQRRNHNKTVTALAAHEDSKPLGIALESLAVVWEGIASRSKNEHDLFMADEARKRSDEHLAAEAVYNANQYREKARQVVASLETDFLKRKKF